MIITTIKQHSYAIFRTFAALLLVSNHALASQHSTPVLSTNNVLEHVSDRTGDWRRITVEIDGEATELTVRPQSLPIGVVSTLRLYSGNVAGDEASWVRLSSADDRTQGLASRHGKLYQIDNSNGILRMQRIGKSTQLDNYTAQMSLTEGWDSPLLPPPAPDQSIHSRFLKQAQASLKPRVAEGQVSELMRIAIVVDSRFDHYYNGKGLETALSVMHQLDGLYQDQFGLGVVVESAILLDQQTDPFLNLDGDIELSLRALRSYTLDQPEIYRGMTLTHLFTGAQDDLGRIGISWIDTACRSDGYNASVSVPFSRQMLLAAHELGHNLGAVHDDSSRCEVEYRKIMWPNISFSTENQFSECSKRSIAPNISNSCNIQNIDVAISLGLQPGTASNTRSLLIAVNNHDPERSTDDVFTYTTLPDQVITLSLPENCTQSAQTLTCEHGTIAALQQSTLEIDLLVGTTTTGMINSEIAIDTFYDLRDTNNRAALDITSNTMATEIPTSGETLSSAGSSSGGSGSGSFITLTILVISWLLRRARYQGQFRELLVTAVTRS